MPLQIPYRFNQDIQTRNTNLVPVVIIGNIVQTAAGSGNPYMLDKDCIYLSTNDITLSTCEIWSTIYDEVTFRDIHYEPLLLNIPKISESIDIQKRKYKISSVSFSILA